MKRARALKQPILMVHGGFSGAWTFDLFRLPFEAAGHAVTAIDLPGHAPGDSRGAVAGQSLTDYVKAVGEAIKAQPAPPVLLGHSMGGLVAQLAAARTSLPGLILLAPSPPWGVAATSPEELLCAFGAAGLGMTSPVIEPQVGPLSRWMLNDLAPADRKAVESRLQSESGRALMETLAWGLDPFASSLVPRGGVRTQVLAFAGERDALHPPATVRAIVERLGGELRVVPSAGHWLPQVPGWDRLAAECIDWIAALEARAAA